MAVIVYKLGADGSFTAGDTESRITSYAYPTSEHATKARKKPEAIAAAMLKNEAHVRPICKPEICAAYDERNWQRLND